MRRKADLTNRGTVYWQSQESLHTIINTLRECEHYAAESFPHGFGDEICLFIYSIAIKIFHNAVGSKVAASY